MDIIDDQDSEERKEFSNWLQCVLALNLAKTALHENVIQKWTEEIESWTEDERLHLEIFLEHVGKGYIKEQYKKQSGQAKKVKKWYCTCCNILCTQIIEKLSAGDRRKYIVWNSKLCTGLTNGTVETRSITDTEGTTISDVKGTMGIVEILLNVFGFGNVFKMKSNATTAPAVDCPQKEEERSYDNIFKNCTEKHIWCLSNMFMQDGVDKNKILNTGPADTDVAMFFRMMWRSELFVISDNDIYSDIIACRNKIHHSATNRVISSDARQYFEQMMKLLQEFPVIKSCQNAVGVIQEMLMRTIYSVSIPDAEIKVMIKEAFRLKDEALKRDIEIKENQGIDCTDLKFLRRQIDDITTDIENNTNYSGENSRRELIEKNEKYMVALTKQDDEISSLQKENENLREQLIKRGRNYCPICKSTDCLSSQFFPSLLEENKS